ncbi:MAG TPA: FUSC family protein [Candidatus Acidoferrum sp.]|nr:FUSC family protein [Candidatus Acidoferrum sp.]
MGVVLPLIAGFALHMPRGGLVVASGALNVSYSDGSDPYSARLRRMLASSVICAVAVFVGAGSGKHVVLSVMLAAVWAFIAGMFVAVGGAAPDLGVISLVTLLIYAAQHLTPREAAISGVLALAGGLLQTALSVALWPVRRYDPERRALEKFYLELANTAAAPWTATSSPRASAQSGQAQEALLGLARDSGAESIRYRALLNQAERIRLTLLMLMRLRLRMEREIPDYPGIGILSGYLQVASQILRHISNALSGAPSTEPDEKARQAVEALDRFSVQLREVAAATPPSFIAAVAKDAVFQMDALSGQLRAALDLSQNSVEAIGVADATSLTPRTWKESFSNITEIFRNHLNLQSPIFRHAIRLAVLVALGDILGTEVSWRRTYWLPMTIALVLKPEFTATFTRGLLRIAGTIVGLLLATALFHLFNPGVVLQVILIFVLVFLLRWLGPANYGIFGTAVSALIVLLLAIAGVPPNDVIWARGINTVVGGSLALLAYWLWPTWERTRVSERIAEMLDAYRNYAHALSRWNPVNMQELESTRRAARSARANLEASIDRLSSEPGTTREKLARLSALLASSHRLIHALMALDAIFSHKPALANSPPLKNFMSKLEKTLALLSSTLRGVREPSKDFPSLREEHRLMVQDRTSGANSALARFDAINVETDRITNSVNTLAEQIMQWTCSPEFAALHKHRLELAAEKANIQ